MGLRCLARADCVAVTAIVRGRDGSWARILAVLTLQCAAKPYWWHGGQLAQVATSRVNVRMKGLSSPGFCVGIFRPLSFVLLCVCFLLVAV